MKAIFLCKYLYFCDLVFLDAKISSVVVKSAILYSLLLSDLYSQQLKVNRQ